MKVTLIRPAFGHAGGKGYDSPARMEPLALGILSALTPRSIGVTAIDERFEPISFDAPTDLVALSVCTFSAKRAYEIAAEYRRRGVPVVMGGFHPTLMPEEAAEHADVVALGDAEACWPDILEDFARGKLKSRYGEAKSNGAPAVAPDRSVFVGKKYLPIRLVQFSRGCHRNCEFCSIRAFYGGGHVCRPIEEVVEEIRGLSGRRIFLVDDNLAGDMKRLRQLLEAMIPLKVRWSSQLDLAVADDPELVRLMQRSGCQSLTIGFESLRPKNLVQMGKAWNRVPTYQRRLQVLREAGIMVYGTFVFGYDADDATVFDEAVAFAVREGMMIANFNPLQPLPGTPLYRRLESEGRLAFERWWLSDDYQWHKALFLPRGMTEQELSHGCRGARERFHAMRSAWKRFWSSPAHRRNVDNAAVFWASNIVSALDIRAKSGLRLGKG
jgi:radical SAM superfamily enzyme YgiQ (UPF0313 family)